MLHHRLLVPLLPTYWVLDLQERLAEAEELCATVLRSAPRNARAFYIRAAVLRKKGNRKGAAEAACEAARLRPDRPSVVLAAGSLLCREKCFARALALYTTALEEDPSNAQYHLGGGWFFKVFRWVRNDV